MVYWYRDCDRCRVGGGALPLMLAHEDQCWTLARIGKTGNILI